MILDYIYIFRFVLAVLLVLVFFILRLVFKKTKLKPVFKIAMVISVALSVMVTLSYLFSPDIYKSKINNDNVTMITDYVNFNLEKIKQGTLPTNQAQKDVYISCEEFESAKSAQEHIDSRKALYCNFFHKDNTDEKSFSAEIDNIKVVASPIYYYDRCTIFFPITYNSYISIIYVLVDNYVITFYIDTARLSSQFQIRTLFG